jgi:hypothetical protein
MRLQASLIYSILKRIIKYVKGLIRKNFLFLYICLILLFNPSFIVASGESINIQKEKINPDSAYYPLKRVLEKGIGAIQLTPQSKINFYDSLLKVRLSELNYVVENKILSYIQTSSERFQYQAGTLTNEINKQNKDKQKIINEYQEMKKNLEPLRDKFPANSSYWLLIQNDINTLSILISNLK